MTTFADVLTALQSGKRAHRLGSAPWVLEKGVEAIQYIAWAAQGGAPLPAAVPPDVGPAPVKPYAATIMSRPFLFAVWSDGSTAPWFPDDRRSDGDVGHPAMKGNWWLFAGTLAWVAFCVVVAQG
jgi:hypothetical protein